MVCQTCGRLAGLLCWYEGTVEALALGSKSGTLSARCWKWREGLTERLNFPSIMLLALRRWRAFSLISYFHSFRWGIVRTSSAIFTAINYNFLFANFIPLHHPQICPYLSEGSQEKDFSSDIDLGFFWYFCVSILKYRMYFLLFETLK